MSYKAIRVLRIASRQPTTQRKHSGEGREGRERYPVDHRPDIRQAIVKAVKEEMKRLGYTAH
jgi:hypothetical protein